LAELQKVTQKHATDPHIPSDKQFPVADTRQQIHSTLYRPILHVYHTIISGTQPFPEQCFSNFFHTTTHTSCHNHLHHLLPPRT